MCQPPKTLKYDDNADKTVVFSGYPMFGQTYLPPEFSRISKRLRVHHKSGQVWKAYLGLKTVGKSHVLYLTTTSSQMATVVDVSLGYSYFQTHPFGLGSVFQVGAQFCDLGQGRSFLNDLPKIGLSDLGTSKTLQFPEWNVNFRSTPSLSIRRRGWG